jgi:hypothetical protein
MPELRFGVFGDAPSQSRDCGIIVMWPSEKRLPLLEPIVATMASLRDA